MVAKVEHMVVEMMEKVVMEMGSLVFYGGKEEEEDDMEVVLLLEMEEEMEGRMVEDLVKEWWRRWWWKWRSSGRPREWAAVFVLRKQRRRKND